MRGWSVSWVQVFREGRGTDHVLPQKAPVSFRSPGNCSSFTKQTKKSVEQQAALPTEEADVIKSLYRVRRKGQEGKGESF